MLAATPLVIGEQEIFASASVGIALSTSPHDSAADLLRDADLAMYRAKALGKARYEVFDTAMHASAVKRLTLETELRKAIEHGEFRVHYQPIVRLSDRKIVGFEALVRWERPNAGLVPPAEFITVAEESGLILPMNRWLRLAREGCMSLCRSNRRKISTQFVPLLASWLRLWQGRIRGIALRSSARVSVGDASS